MKVSELFDLDQTQGALDFVDVDVDKDVAVFIDPRAIRIQQGAWHDSCVDLLQSFFHEVLNGVSSGDYSTVKNLLSRLTEPNETHLGVSRGRSRGRGLGGSGAERIVDSLSRSRAAMTGLLEDLEDTALFIEGIGPDIISDITTNVIRGPLIEYTQQVCEYYEIPVEDDLYVGWCWDADELRWIEQRASLPVANQSILLLVPRSIVRVSLIFDPERYYSRSIAPIHEGLELKDGSSLVHALKNGRQIVYQYDLIDKYGNSKGSVIKHTEEHPEALQDFRKPAVGNTPPLPHDQLNQRTNSPDVDFHDLLGAIRAVQPGWHGATAYHRAVKDFLSAIFYPFLANATAEKNIHDGRKRLDINFDNVASSGFFHWLAMHRAASQIVVECKNYQRDPENPELDQIGGRFSPQRTQIGIVVCRQIKNKEKFAERCRDTAKDARGYVLYLDDDDLRELIKEDRPGEGEYLLLRTQFDYLVD